MTSHSSMSQLLESLGLDAQASWSIYPSAGSDTHPVVYLGEQALRHKATAGCAALGLDLPEPPRLQVMVDSGVDPSGRLFYLDERTYVSVVSGPEPMSIAGLRGSLAVVRFESAYEGWSPEEVFVVRLKAHNEQFAEHVAAERLAPSVLVGVTDGCAFGGNRHCVNRLVDPQGMCATRSHLVPPWWVTDHFADAEPATGLETGTVVRSIHADFPFQFRAVALLSEAWGRYAGWGFGGSWLFRVEPAE